MPMLKKNRSTQRKQPLLKRPQKERLEGLVRFDIKSFEEVIIAIRGENQLLKKLAADTFLEEKPLQKQLVEKLFFPATSYSTNQSEEEQFIIAVLDLFQVDQLYTAEEIVGLKGYVELSWYYSETNGQSYPRFTNWQFDSLEPRREETDDSNP